LVVCLLAFGGGAAIYCEATHGEIVERGPDGRIFRRVPVDYSGRPHGIELMYSVTGELYARTHYSHGDAVKRTTYDADGRVLTSWEEGPGYQQVYAPIK
jgi:hypothetical protein